MTLEEQRRDAADEAYQGYDFVRQVESHSGWETEVPGDETYRKVFLENGDGDTEQVNFVVSFARNSARIVDVYAIDSRGNIFGCRAAEGTDNDCSP